MSSFESSFFLLKEEGKQSVQWRLGKDFSVEFQTYLILTSDIFHRISAPVCSFRENLPCFAETQIVLTFQSFVGSFMSGGEGHQKYRLHVFWVFQCQKNEKFRFGPKCVIFHGKCALKVSERPFRFTVIVSWSSSSHDNSLIIINMTLIWLSLHDNNLKIFVHG